MVKLGETENGMNMTRGRVATNTIQIVDSVSKPMSTTISACANGILNENDFHTDIKHIQLAWPETVLPLRVSLA